MKLTCEALPETTVATAADIERAFANNAFGTFLILSASETSYLQAATLPDANSPCRLEYRDGATGKQYAAQGGVTLPQVKEAFLDYLRGGTRWRTNFSWAELNLP